MLLAKNKINEELNVSSSTYVFALRVRKQKHDAETVFLLDEQPDGRGLNSNNHLSQLYTSAQNVIKSGPVKAL